MMKSLHKVIDIIDTIAELGSVGIRDLSAGTGYPPATTYRIVATLSERNYLQQDPITRKYSLSLRFLELGTKVRQQYSLARIARPHLERLMAETKENANLCVLAGDEVIYLDHEHSDDHMLQSFTRLGARVPLYATGVGKALLSQWTESEVHAYLERVEFIPKTTKTLTDKTGLSREIGRIQSKGFAVDNEEMEEGIRCIAAPIFDHNGRPCAAISVSGPTLRIPRKRIKGLGSTVIHYAQIISGEMGFQGKE